MKRLDFKYIFVSFFVILLIYSQTFAYADSFDFGDGYNNDFSNNSKVAAVLSSVLAYNRIFINTSNVSGWTSGDASLYAYKMANILHEYDNNLYSAIVDDVDININEHSKAVIDFANLSGTMVIGLDNFIEYLFGDGALTQDPVNVDVQTPYTITVNNQDVIPWLSNMAGYTGDASQYNVTYDFGWVSSRGSYIVPYQGAYQSWYTDTYNNNSSHEMTQSFNCIDENGTPFTYTTRKFRCDYNANDASYGEFKKLTYWRGPGTSDFAPVWWQNEDSSQVGLCAFLPVIFTDGKLGFYCYSYAYTGIYRPWIFQGHNYILISVVHDSSKKKPFKNNHGSFNLSGTFNEDILPSNNIIVVDASSNDDIINNYYNNNLIVNRYTDPFTDWDTSSGGTLTPDGNGGFNLDLGNFHLPDLNIDWSLDGLSEKFPFSIPFDIVKFFTILNTEPETPSIDETIDLGVASWHIDYDFHQFDDFAAFFRNIEYIFFVIGLLFFTKDFLRR